MARTTMLQRRGSDGEHDRHETELRSLKGSLAAAAILPIPVFNLGMGLHLVPAIHEVVMDTVGMRESWRLLSVRVRRLGANIPKLEHWVTDENLDDEFAEALDFLLWCGS